MTLVVIFADPRAPQFILTETTAALICKLTGRVTVLKLEELWSAARAVKEKRSTP